MEEKTFIGLKPNILFGLNWLFFPFGIIALAIDHSKMTDDDKKQIISCFIVVAFMSIVGGMINFIHIIFCQFGIYWFHYFGCINLVPAVFVIIAAVQAFRGIEYHYPIAYDMAVAFLPKNNNQEKAEEKKEI